MCRLLALTLVIALLGIPVVALAQDDLTETYHSFDDSLTFRYPAGWIADGYGNDWGYVANSQAALNTRSRNEQVLSGQVVMSIHVIPFASSEEVVSAEDMLEAMQASYDAISPLKEQYNIDVSLVSAPAFVEGLDNAVEMTYLRTGANFVEQVLDIVIIYGDTGMAEMSVTAVEGELAQVHDLMIRIAATVVYKPPSAGGLVVAGSGPAPLAGSGNVVWTQERSLGSGPENFRGLKGLSIGTDGLIYVVDSEVGVRVLDADGNLLRTIMNTEITHLSDIAVAADGTLWLVNDYAHKVYHVDSQGNMLASFGETGSEPGQFGDLSPNQIELGADGNLYLANHTEEQDFPKSEILVYAPDGTFIREFASDPNPDDGYDLFGNLLLAAAPDGTLYVADLFTMGIRAFAPDGTVLQNGIGRQALMGVQQLAVGQDGSIYAVGVSMETFIYKFDKSGNLLSQTNVTSIISFPAGMAILPDHSIIIDGTSLQRNPVILRLR